MAYVLILLVNEWLFSLFFELLILDFKTQCTPPPEPWNMNFHYSNQIGGLQTYALTFPFCVFQLCISGGFFFWLFVSLFVLLLLFQLFDSCGHSILSVLHFAFSWVCYFILEKRQYSVIVKYTDYKARRLAFIIVLC